MKREKIIFALFVMPIFLFSASIKHWKLDREKNQSSLPLPKQIISQDKGQPAQSKVSKSELNQSSPKIKRDFPGLAKETSGRPYLSKKIESVTPGRKRNFRPGRVKKPNSSISRHQIKHINKGQPFRYEGPQYVPDEILVKFKPTLSEQTIKTTIAAYQSKKLKRIPRIDVYKIQIQKSTTLEETLYALRRNPDVEYAEPNYKVHIAVTPDDDLFWRQYALSNPGGQLPIPGSPQGEEDADIKATAAWEETKGDEDIIIAVIDTGVDLDHPDINDKIYSSGYDFVNDDSDATDDHMHGTSVAGIAAAETDNEEGIAGVAWNCKILPVKVLDNLGDGEIDNLANGIIWAATEGADVINLSLEVFFHSQTIEDAVEFAYENNIVIVAAAGNDGGSVAYPAAYDDCCLAVAATNYNDERVTFENSSDDPLYKWESNYGPEVDVAAPGAEIVSLVPTWFPAQEGWTDPYPYGAVSGTSMAVPHVAGLAALIKSVKPDLTAAQIMNVIRYTADDVNFVNNVGKDNYLGWGRINLKLALVPTIIVASK
jgi:subtilisin family serine protease